MDKEKQASAEFLLLYIVYEKKVRIPPPRKENDKIIITKTKTHWPGN